MLVVATGNQGKMRELARILPEETLVSMREIGIDADIEENGATFEENALIKAREICRMSGKATMADDSGLTVDALGGAPGIYSARYGGEGLSDRDRTAKLLGELQAVEDAARGAAFVCVIAYVTPEGEEFTFRGECRGKIIREMRGDGGFGYDPVFVPEGYEKTFSELPQDEKNAISHRAKAMKELKLFLNDRK